MKLSVLKAFTRHVFLILLNASPVRYFNHCHSVLVTSSYWVSIALKEKFTSAWHLNFSRYRFHWLRTQNSNQHLNRRKTKKIISTTHDTETMLHKCIFFPNVFLFKRKRKSNLISFETSIRSIRKKMKQIWFVSQRWPPTLWFILKYQICLNEPSRDSLTPLQHHLGWTWHYCWLNKAKEKVLSAQTPLKFMILRRDWCSVEQDACS